jgi:hypothetical protein
MPINGPAGLVIRRALYSFLENPVLLFKMVKLILALLKPAVNELKVNKLLSQRTQILL